MRPKRYYKLVKFEEGSLVSSFFDKKRTYKFNIPTVIDKDQNPLFLYDSYENAINATNDIIVYGHQLFFLCKCEAEIVPIPQNFEEFINLFNKGTIFASSITITEIVNHPSVIYKILSKDMESPYVYYNKLKYNIRATTTPIIPNSKIFCYENIYSAMNNISTASVFRLFLGYGHNKHRIKKRSMLVCEDKNSFANFWKMKKHKKKITVRTIDAENDIVVCDKICLTKEIPVRELSNCINSV